MVPEHRLVPAFPVRMPLILQKIFMLQRHQLIRWGTTSGYLGVVSGLLFMVIAVTGMVVIPSKLAQAEARTADSRKHERSVILNSRNFEELRSFTLEGNGYNASMESIYWESIGEMIQCVAIILAGASVLAVGYGLLSLRMKELATELEGRPITEISSPQMLRETKDVA